MDIDLNIKPTVILMGYLGPPTTGMVSATKPLLSGDLNSFEIRFVDMTGADSLAGVGRISVRTLAAGARFLGRLVRAKPWRADLVHYPIAQAGPAFVRDIVVLAFLNLLGSRVVLHLHGGHLCKKLAKRGMLNMFGTRVVARAEVGIVLSESLRPALNCVLSDDALRVVANGSEDFGIASRAPGTRLRIGYIGALSEAKGVPRLIEACRQLEGVELHLAGEWMLSGVRPEEVQNLHYWGSVSGDRKYDFFASIDVFAMPTEFHLEGQPISLIEAMSSGLPTVVSDWAALPDTVADGNPVVSSSAELFQALASLKDADYRQVLGAKNRARWEDHYTTQAYVARVANTWRSTLRRPS